VSGTTFDDPNRESLGLAPIWTGAGDDAPAPEPEPDPEQFDPAAHTVDDVLAYVDGHPDAAASVLEAERAGKARTTLLDALEERTAT